MTYTKEEVMEIVRGCLGENANGLYVDDARLNFNKCYNTTIFTSDGFDVALCETDVATYSAGCTKVVLIPFDADYVIKLPIAGSYTQNTDGQFEVKNICRGNIFRMEDKVFGETGLWCQKMILRNVYVGQYNGIPVFVQEQVDMVADEARKPVRAELSVELDTMFHGRDKIEGLTKEFAQEVLFFYGKDAVYDIISGLDYELWDLHDENYGYLKDGTPVIFDIGGNGDVWFPEDEDDEEEWQYAS